MKQSIPLELFKTIELLTVQLISITERETFFRFECDSFQTSFKQVKKIKILYVLQ